MAQSRDDMVSNVPNVTFDRNDLPEGEARLVICEKGVTTIIQGDTEEVARRFDEQLTEKLDTSIEDSDIDEYPMPDNDAGLVSADEFYDQSAN